MDFSLGLGLLGLGSSVISGLFGSSSQSSANKANQAINAAQLRESQRQFDTNFQWNTYTYQDQKKFSEAMQNRQYLYQRGLMDLQKSNQMDLNQQGYDLAMQMQQYQNEYNSAANQRKRLEEAGLNPYLMMSGGSAGVATGGVSSGGSAASGSASVGSVPSASAVPTTASYHPIAMQANQSVEAALVDGLFNFSQRLAATRKANAEAQSVETHNKFQEQQIMLGLDRLKADVGSARARAEIDDMEASFKRATFSSDVMKNNYDAMLAKANVSYMWAQAGLTAAQSALSTNQLRWMDKQMQSQLALQSAQVVSSLAGAKLSEQQAKTEIEKRLSSQSQPFRMLSKEQQQRYVENFVKQIENLTRQQGADYWNPFGYVGKALGASASVTRAIK